ncbi:hypothetical protein BJ875DRAFT_231249 [Amylocarpus encephaloides]|uniref:Transmembrane protein n=1 Tax=Amylocarpus encephaloides TaxID=45428 RepID=A0A9P7YMY1_9HELO|nr:hypothetical protein BJ875DRAFT_231249 [Amylocarpus encephaloides]
MAQARTASRHNCYCRNSALPCSSTLLFLSFILPSSSFAQLTDQPTQLTSRPTILATSASTSEGSDSSIASSSASSIPSGATSPRPSRPHDESDTPPSATPISSQNAHVFNYYFLIVAVAAVLFCFCLLYIGKRKKQKAALLRRNSQRALAQDVAGFRERFGRPRNNNGMVFWNGRATRQREQERVEGLDERGEAPPPYVPGTKPPSLRNVRSHRISGDIADRGTSENSNNQAVELRSLGTAPVEDEAHGPPSYHETTSHGEEDIADITRPTPAATAAERSYSARRLLGGSNR